jgi:hypothetical protein
VEPIKAKFADHIRKLEVLSRSLTGTGFADLKARVLSRLRAELAVELADIVAGRTVSDAAFAAAVPSSIDRNAAPLPTEPLQKTEQSYQANRLSYEEENWARLSPRRQIAHNKLRKARGLPPILPEPKEPGKSRRRPLIRPVDDDSDRELAAVVLASRESLRPTDRDVFHWHLEKAMSQAMTPQATDADLEPLRQLVVARCMGHPGVAQFIQRPPQPERGARRDYARSQPFKLKHRSVWLAEVRRIEEIVADITGKQRDTSPLVVAIAADFLGCSETEIKKLKKLKKHPPPDPPPAPSEESDVEFAARILERESEFDAIFRYLTFTLWKTGKAPSDDEIVAYAAALLKCDPAALREIIKRKKTK